MYGLVKGLCADTQYKDVTYSTGFGYPILYGGENIKIKIKINEYPKVEIMKKREEKKR